MYRKLKKNNNIMPDKIAFATVQKDMEPKPNGWAFSSRQSYPTLGAYIGGGTGSQYYDCWYGGEEGCPPRPELNPPLMTPGTQEDWTNHIISQNSLFSGFIKYSSRGEVWNGNVIQTQMTSEYFRSWSGNIYTYNYPLLKPASQYPDSILVGPGTNYVGPFSIEEAAEIVWRVKKWKVNFNPTSQYVRLEWDGEMGEWVEAESFQPSLAPVEYRQRGIGDNPYWGTNQYTSEKQFFMEKKGYVVQTSFSGSVYEYPNRLSLQVFHDVVSLIDDPSKYYIKMDLQVSVQSTVNSQDGSASKGLGFGLGRPLGFTIVEESSCPDNPTYSRYFAPWSDGLDLGWYKWNSADYSGNSCDTMYGGLTTTSQMQFTLPNGRSIQIPLYGSISTYRYHPFSPDRIRVQYDQFLTTPTIGSLSIEPLEYWPYDDGNGNPIWDTQTGAMLRDPVTGLPVS
jgi:hypothetical protein